MRTGYVACEVKVVKVMHAVQGGSSGGSVAPIDEGATALALSGIATNVCPVRHDVTYGRLARKVFGCAESTRSVNRKPCADDTKADSQKVRPDVAQRR